MISKLKLSLMTLTTGLSLSLTAQSPLENLFRLEGSWAGEATLILEGNTFNFTYYADFKKNDEGSGMNMEEWFSHPDLGSLKGYNLIGYNARDQKIHWFTVDNFGTCHDHLGYWKTSDHFYMETTEKHGGKKFEEKIDLIFKGEDELMLHLVATIGGQLFEDAVVIFHRQTNKSRSAANGLDTNAERKPSQLTKDISENAGLSVYPNPANGKINFQFPNNLSLQQMRLSVFNILGEKMKEVSVHSLNTDISLAGYKPGTYLYRVFHKDQVLYSGKFIVQ